MSKKIVSLLLALLMMFSMSAVLAEESVTVTDMFDREITIKGPISRVVVMEPAECEILCALGGEELLVGRGAYCDYPEAVLELPALQSGSLTNMEEVLALDPQLIIMSGMDHPKEQVDQLESNGVKVITTYAASIEETYECIQLIGNAIGRSDQAQALVAEMMRTFADAAAKSEKTDKTIYFEVMPLEWGLWSAGAGTFMHELAEICGMKNAFADVNGWQAISQEQVIERDPDYIVLVTGMGETAVDEVLGRAGWGDIKAVKNGAVYNADSYAITRPGPRLKDAALELNAFLNGEAAE
jgi:iron complex transport system substrate-binding protein